MKKIDALAVTKEAISMTMGSEYAGLEGWDELKALDSQKIIDVGSDVTNENTISSLTNNLIALIGKHVIDSREFVDTINSINVESYDWGGYIERTRIGLGEIMDDPMYSKTVGQNYSAIENTYYGQPVQSKIFQECKAVMTPISVEKEILREAFTSADKLESFISARETQIRNTLKLALHVYKKMLFACAVAVSDEKLDSALHLISEAVARGIISQINEGTEEDPVLRNPTYIEVRDNKNFLKFCAERISEVRDYMKEISTAFNDGSIPTWTVDEPRLELLADFEKAIKFNLKADTFNKDELGFGEYERITSWQGIKDSTSKDFDTEVLSTVKLAADSTNKLGIGTSEYSKAGVVGLLFDPMAIGMCLYRNKVSSGYVSCADFWNIFHHMLVNYLIDDSYGLCAIIMD